MRILRKAPAKAVDVKGMHGHVVLHGAEKLRCGGFVGMPISENLGMHPPWISRG